MFKFLNYVRIIISFLIFSLLSACSDNGSFFNNRISGEEYGDTKEAKLIKYYSRLEERKISLGLLRQDGGGTCLLYTSPSPRDLSTSRMPSSA